MMEGKLIRCSSASAMKNTPLKLSYVYQCTGCDAFHLQPIARTVSKVCFLIYCANGASCLLVRCTWITPFLRIQLLSVAISDMFMQLVGFIEFG